MILFFFKKIVGPLFSPLTLILILLGLGLFFLFFTRRQRSGKIFVLIGTLLFGFMSFDGISGRILRPLEYKYPPLLSMKDIPDVKWIVVLGGGHASDPKLPVTSYLSEDSLPRLVEGIRLHQEFPQSKLILTGGKLFDRISETRALANVALLMGAKKDDLILEETSKDTEEQAQLIQQMIDQERFILVTSAYHMLRSVALFKRLGLNPIPAPTDYSVKERQRITPWNFYSSTHSLRKAEKAFHEYLGWAWAKLIGRI